MFFLLLQQHLRKWMEVVVITHKGGQRSDGSVSISLFLYICMLGFVGLWYQQRPVFCFSLNYLLNLTRVKLRNLSVSGRVMWIWRAEMSGLDWTPPPAQVAPLRLCEWPYYNQWLIRRHPPPGRLSNEPQSSGSSLSCWTDNLVE